MCMHVYAYVCTCAHVYVCGPHRTNKQLRTKLPGIAVAKREARQSRVSVLREGNSQSKPQRDGHQLTLSVGNTIGYSLAIEADELNLSQWHP